MKVKGPKGWAGLFFIYIAPVPKAASPETFIGPTPVDQREQ